MRLSVIQSDHKSRSFYDHLPEVAIERYCTNGTTGSVVDDSHLALCLDCTQRGWEMRDFLESIDRAVESLMSGSTTSAKTH